MGPRLTSHDTIELIKYVGIDRLDGLDLQWAQGSSLLRCLVKLARGSLTGPISHPKM